MGLKPETVVAICAVVIAVASLVVSVYQTRAIREHNRHSVRPILLHRAWRSGDRAGIRLTNAGLGPAVITGSTLTVDGVVIGPWDRASVDSVRDRLGVRPNAVTFSETEVLAIDYERYLLSVACYDKEQHAELADLINNRLTLEIRYESLYGGENFRTTLNPRS